MTGSSSTCTGLRAAHQGIFALADQILVPVTPEVPTIRAAVQFREVAVDLEIRDRLP